MKSTPSQRVNASPKVVGVINRFAVCFRRPVTCNHRLRTNPPRVPLARSEFGTRVERRQEIQARYGAIAVHRRRAWPFARIFGHPSHPSPARRCGRQPVCGSPLRRQMPPISDGPRSRPGQPGSHKAQAKLRRPAKHIGGPANSDQAAAIANQMAGTRAPDHAHRRAPRDASRRHLTNAATSGSRLAAPKSGGANDRAGRRQNPCCRAPTRWLWPMRRA